MPSRGHLIFKELLGTTSGATKGESMSSLDGADPGTDGSVWSEPIFPKGADELFFIVDMDAITTISASAYVEFTPDYSATTPTWYRQNLKLSLGAATTGAVVASAANGVADDINSTAGGWCLVENPFPVDVGGDVAFRLVVDTDGADSDFELGKCYVATVDKYVNKP